ncbi:photosynthetic complex assembly protein PuhC [Falsiroseomonas oryzae]|uniref:photosynthetic complex assembly protein PuhC n=1 Tax=Falsiroseomonas oryzae TaxID=2766473 RepID=UPI0022EB8BBA|nr:photosynthetic complex assembly protein PuhC [Roseomonas sp. MO-31]
MGSALLRTGRLPRGMVLGTGLVVAGTFMLATLGHRAPLDPAVSGMLPTATRELRFADRADGAVVVTDARTGRQVEVVEPGTEGFVRGAMRGLGRQRRISDVGPDVPFRLSVWPDGRITLHDIANGNTMELHAFGRTNAEAFLRLLATEE